MSSRTTPLRAKMGQAQQNPLNVSLRLRCRSHRRKLEPVDSVYTVNSPKSRLPHRHYEPWAVVTGTTNGIGRASPSASLPPGKLTSPERRGWSWTGGLPRKRGGGGHLFEHNGGDARIKDLPPPPRHPPGLPLYSSPDCRRQVRIQTARTCL